MYKQAIKVFFALLIAPAGLFAQIYVKSPGNVGIGINTPQEKLHLSGKMLIESNGDGNILTFNNTDNSWQYIAYKKSGVRQVWMGLNDASDFYLTKETPGNIVFNPSNGRVMISSDDNGGIGGSITLAHPGKVTAGTANRWTIYNMSNGYGNSLQFWAYDNVGCVSGGLCTPRMVIMDQGNVGIGTTAPHAKLTVAGNIKASSFVAPGQTYADYVFLPSYRLRPLSEVEQYIQQQHHLPEVPSAEEVERDGLNLGDQQVMLLKKVEELTLYMIEQNKKNEEQQELIKKLNNLVESQQDRINALEKSLKNR